MASAEATDPTAYVTELRPCEPVSSGDTRLQSILWKVSPDSSNPRSVKSSPPCCSHDSEGDAHLFLGVGEALDRRAALLDAFLARQANEVEQTKSAPEASDPSSPERSSTGWARLIEAPARTIRPPIGSAYIYPSVGGRNNITMAQRFGKINKKVAVEDSAPAPKTAREARRERIRYLEQGMRRHDEEKALAIGEGTSPLSWPNAPNFFAVPPPEAKGESRIHIEQRIHLHSMHRERKVGLKEDLIAGAVMPSGDITATRSSPPPSRLSAKRGGGGGAVRSAADDAHHSFEHHFRSTSPTPGREHEGQKEELEGPTWTSPNARHVVLGSDQSPNGYSNTKVYSTDAAGHGGERHGGLVEGRHGGLVEGTERSSAVPAPCMPRRGGLPGLDPAVLISEANILRSQGGDKAQWSRVAAQLSTKAYDMPAYQVLECVRILADANRKEPQKGIPSLGGTIGSFKKSTGKWPEVTAATDHMIQSLTARLQDEPLPTLVEILETMEVAQVGTQAYLDMLMTLIVARHHTDCRALTGQWTFRLATALGRLARPGSLRLRPKSYGGPQATTSLRVLNILEDRLIEALPGASPASLAELDDYYVTRLVDEKVSKAVLTAFAHANLGFRPGTEQFLGQAQRMEESVRRELPQTLIFSLPRAARQYLDTVQLTRLKKDIPWSAPPGLNFDLNAR